MSEFTIPLNRGQVAVVDEADFATVSKAQWFANWNPRSNTFYAQRHWHIDGRRTTLQMHRMLLGVTDPRVIVDHINHNGLDNRRVNLRTCSSSENLCNRVKRTKKVTSQFKGVSRHSGGKWQATIQANLVTRYLGLFSSEESAARAYDDAARELHGEFALLNFG